MKKKTTGQLVLSGTEEEIFKRLQERVDKAIAMIQDLRRERDSLREKLNAAKDNNELKGEFDRLQKERSEIRNRIESILSNLETLD